MDDDVVGESRSRIDGWRTRRASLLLLAAMSDVRRPTFSIAGVLVLGLVFHLIFINSVFDCYFTSHVVHGMRRFRTQSADAKRLVLIVGPSCLAWIRSVFMRE
jgi:hypothetical protein